jgi:hypothetical protein
MKKIKYTISLALLALGLCTTSCNDDFLENDIKSRLTDDMQWSSEGNADLFLNDIYAVLSNKWNSPDNLDNFTDDNDAGFYWKSYSWRQGIVDPAVNNGTPMDHANANATDYASWAAGFLKIRKCNLFIQKITENSANFSEAYRKKRIDEVRFMRAYYYSELFLHLGGLPIITEVLDRNAMGEEELYRPRATFEETFNFITKELGEIVSNKTLPVKYNNGDADAGRATLGAALALKGWLELYAASPAFNAATPAAGADPNKLVGFGNFDAKRWAAAAATNKQFIDTYGSTYALFPDVNAFWWEKNEYNSEVIWDRQVVGVIMGPTMSNMAVRCGSMACITPGATTARRRSSSTSSRWPMANPFPTLLPVTIRKTRTKAAKSASMTSSFTTARRTSRIGWPKRIPFSPVSTR